MVTRADFECNRVNLAKTVWKSNSNQRNSNFWFGDKTGFPKLLLFFLNNLKNSQHESCSTFCALQLSCCPLFQIPNGFWIGGLIWKRGHFSEICIFKITLNFVLKLQKLKTPKLYILPRATTLLLNLTSNFAWFISYAKRGKFRVPKSGFSPLSFSENLHPRVVATTQASTRHISTLYFPKLK